MVNQMDMCHVLYSSIHFFWGFWHNFGSHPAKKKDGTKDGCARTPAHKRIMHKLMLGYVQSLRTILRARKAASCWQKKSLTNSMTKNVQTKIPESIDPFQQPAISPAPFFSRGHHSSGWVESHFAPIYDQLQWNPLRRRCTQADHDNFTIQINGYQKKTLIWSSGPTSKKILESPDLVHQNWWFDPSKMANPLCFNHQKMVFCLPRKLVK